MFKFVGNMEKQENIKKVLFVTNYKPGRGGISGQVEYLMRYLANEKEFDTGIFSTKGSFFHRMILLFPLIFKARGYDIVHVHGCSGYGFLPVVYGVIAGRLCGKKVIVTYHGGGADAFFSKHPRWVRFWLMKADERVVLSGFLKAVFDKFSIPSAVIPNVVELNGDIYAEKTVLQPHFISVRHLRDLYNIPCILRAFDRVQKKIPDATLTVLGEGDRRGELEDFVKAGNIRNVEFLGQVPNEAIGDYLKRNDIMLSAPREDNMPVSLLEAFSAGLLVISSNVGGVPYMMENGKTGLLFESDNDEEMAEKMLWALSHQEESLRMIVNAKREVGKYSWERVGKQIKSLYI